MHHHEADVHFATTPVEVHFSDLTVEICSGFFFHTLKGGPKQLGEPPGWTEISSTSLVVCRHSIEDKTHSAVEKVVFSLRSQAANGSVSWVPWTVTRVELVKNTLRHQADTVDLAALNLDGLMGEISERQLSFRSFGDGAIPNEHNPLVPYLGGGVLVAGYPSGLADQTNCFPIVKSGVLASKWGMNWEGEPRFLIDAQLFPGSSGSVVLSQPTQIVIHDGQIMHSPTPQVVVLGVYLGAPEWDEHVPESLGLG